MKKKYLLVLLASAWLYASPESLEVMRPLAENPPKKYTNKNQKSATAKVVDSTQSKVFKSLSHDKLSMIKAKLKALHKKINSHSHKLKLEKRAKQHVIEEHKHSSKSKRLRETRKRLKTLKHSIHSGN